MIPRRRTSGRRGDVIVVRSWDREVYLRARTNSDGDHVTLIDGVGFIVSPDEAAEFIGQVLSAGVSFRRVLLNALKANRFQVARRS